jgi:hypothetical protein
VLGAAGPRVASSCRLMSEAFLDASTLLTQLKDDVELALERLEPDTEDMEEEEDMEAAEAEANATDMEDEEDAGEEQGKARFMVSCTTLVIIIVTYLAC